MIQGFRDFLCSLKLIPSISWDGVPESDGIGMNPNSPDEGVLDSRQSFHYIFLCSHSGEVQV